MDLTSARGTKLNDIVIGHRPSTGRGKKLTLAQEGVLRRLYEQELPSVSNDEVPVKAFWLNLASRFHDQTGREYSWLSVKRRAAGWGHKSPEVDHRLDISRDSELVVENSVAEPSHEDVAHESPRKKGSCDSEQPALPQQKPSLHSQDSNIPKSSQLERNPDSGDWLQRSSLPGTEDPIQDKNSNVKCPRVAQRRPRSISPHRGLQPRYRYRSPSTTRRTKIVSRRLHHHLGSSSDGMVMPAPYPLSGSSPAHEDIPLGHLSTQAPPEFSRLRKSVEKSEPQKSPRDGARSKRGESKVSDGVLGSAHLFEQDGLPPTPTRIMRRRVAK
ncbi:uncharacterized protein N7500_004039 [Penicillium coprophilum]|uniref:uncharacterized protein n=1 Tax=Penicillium coprophilum TaxID=36646 RepID=UPI0023A0A290|nr:uncharacterized protein N7500_004039 [Penicillium coprophilum]KAJ5171256.1 hypothetical protein N7500_004039 [Penicillium coprophilum]